MALADNQVLKTALQRDHKAAVLAGLIRERIGSGGHRILVVGCGSGVEAATLADELGGDVTGIDLKPAFDARLSSVVRLQVGDATALEFADEQFTFVYSYHALEHIPNYQRALNEMRRVLKKGGRYCVGTPNRSRLVGYLGATDTAIGMKLKWNMDDWKARLQGRFRNEYGAHAGFSAAELRAQLETVFGNAEDITLAYYRALYSRWDSLLRGTARSGLHRYLLPSVYFFGTR